MWRVRAESFVKAMEESLAFNAAATDQAIRDFVEGVEPFVPLQNPVELAALVSATRTSAKLAAEAESRCAKEHATLKALRAKLMDVGGAGDRVMQNVLGWECPCVTNKVAYPVRVWPP